jgi:hypothetical protein
MKGDVKIPTEKTPTSRQMIRISKFSIKRLQLPLVRGAG